MNVRELVDLLRCYPPDTQLGVLVLTPSGAVIDMTGADVISVDATVGRRRDAATSVDHRSRRQQRPDTDAGVVADAAADTCSSSTSTTPGPQHTSPTSATSTPDPAAAAATPLNPLGGVAGG